MHVPPSLVWHWKPAAGTSQSSRRVAPRRGGQGETPSIRAIHRCRSTSGEQDLVKGGVGAHLGGTEGCDPHLRGLRMGLPCSRRAGFAPSPSLAWKGPAQSGLGDPQPLPLGGLFLGQTQGDGQHRAQGVFLGGRLRARRCRFLREFPRT